MKILVTIVVTTVVMLFAMQNFGHVPINFFGSKPLYIRLFFVIVFSGVLGWLIRFITGMHREEELKRRYRVLLNEYKRLKAQVSQED
ncbi:MAG: hypothetical protein OEY01_10575 [Desulfobulbaceae bacterium]|nr:hypothetical protein [Desulfobulbaceae bacterium]HIJ79393.1 DUF1049 domain-containing protein [Deltaproteobacteria bacterium]